MMKQDFPRMRLYKLHFIIVVLLLAGSTKLIAQTCSCSGSPYIGTQNSGLVSNGSLNLGLHYRYQDISNLYHESQQINTTSTIFQNQDYLVVASYGLTDRLILSSTLSYVIKERTSGLLNNQSNVIRVNGLGEGTIVAKYIILPSDLWNRWQIAIGTGGKIPIGSNSLRINGSLLNADLQPSTGSWDLLLWNYMSYDWREQQIQFFMSNRFRKTGSSERFDESDRYKFGNELTLKLGTNVQFNELISGTLQTTYRYSTLDKLNGTTIASTGGHWFNVAGQVGISFLENMELSIGGSYPLYQKVNGIQPSTSFILNAALQMHLFGDPPTFQRQ